MVWNKKGEGRVQGRDKNRRFLFFWAILKLYNQINGMSVPTRLNRALGLRLAFFLVIGNIIGSGVYKKVVPMAAELHSSGWVLICWVLGGIISLFGALSNAEVASMLAVAVLVAALLAARPESGRTLLRIVVWAGFAA